MSELYLAVIGVALISLIVGFLLGIGFTLYAFKSNWERHP